MTNHAMIDLETLNTTPDSVVLTLGAVKFNPFNLSEPTDELYLKINIDEQDALGRTTSDDTIAWWAKQDQKIQDEAFSEEGRVSVNEALDILTKWVWGCKTIWGQGYGFDMTILESMYRDVSRPIPWNFWQIMDSRTLFSVLPKDPRKSMQSDLHNALADAYYQAKAVQLAYKELGIRK
jgi:hypothetical protein